MKGRCQPCNPFTAAEQGAVAGLNLGSEVSQVCCNCCNGPTPAGCDIARFTTLFPQPERIVLPEQCLFQDSGNRAYMKRILKLIQSIRHLNHLQATLSIQP